MTGKKLFSPKITATVTGVDPNTGEKVVSNLYDSVSEQNMREVFQTDLESKFGSGVYGGKAVAYMGELGEINLVFMTETESTHHRHTAATMFGLENTEALALYEGDVSKAAPLLYRSFGFEMQFDSNSGKIVGIQQDSWITKRQIEQGIRFSRQTLDDVVLKLTESIDPSILSDPYEGANWIDNENQDFAKQLPIQDALVPPELVAIS